MYLSLKCYFYIVWIRLICSWFFWFCIYYFLLILSCNICICCKSILYSFSCICSTCYLILVIYIVFPSSVFIFCICCNNWCCKCDFFIWIYPEYSCLRCRYNTVVAFLECYLNIIVRNYWLIFARSLWNNIFCKVILCNKSCILIIFCFCNKLRTPSVIASFLFVIVYASYCRWSKSNFFVWINKEYSCICCCSLAV